MPSGARVHDRMPALLAEQDFKQWAERHRWRRAVEVGRRHGVNAGRCAQRQRSRGIQAARPAGAKEYSIYGNVD
jgi:putative SOS response-associated peptidase YedK